MKGEERSNKGGVWVLLGRGEARNIRLLVKRTVRVKYKRRHKKEEAKKKR